MQVKDLIYKQRTLRPYKAFISPDFKAKSVLASSHWDFVELFLKRESTDISLFYWRQARAFYDAALNLPTESSPLTLYYCFLNAGKALLECKGQLYSKRHGVSGDSTTGNTNLKNEIISFKSSGVASALGRYFQDDTIEDDYSMWALLYNLAFVHRAFNLSYPTESSELFIPIKNLRFVISDFQHYGWFVAETYRPYESQHTLNKIEGIGFRKDGQQDKFAIRFEKKFKWYHQGVKKNNNLNRLSNYQNRFRKHLSYIYGDNALWYIKRTGVNNLIDKHPVTIIFGLMHRLSELARYEPLTLNKHFKLRQNWLLTEFINGSADQFIDMISCEITNSNIMRPAIRK